MQLIQDFLKGSGPELAKQLVSKCQFTDAQANGFLKGILDKVTKMIGAGQLDVNALLGSGGAKTLLSKLSAGDFATGGLDVKKAESGLKEIAGPLTAKLGQFAGNAEGLMGLLGGKKEGLVGAAGKLASGLFGKK
jgi:hypothetical protein